MLERFKEAESTWDTEMCSAKGI